MALSKGEIMNLVYGDHYTGIDSALPLHFVKNIKAALQPFNMEFDTSLHVVNYNNEGNALDNLGEVLITSGKLEELIRENQTLKFELYQLKNKVSLNN